MRAEESLKDSYWAAAVVEGATSGGCITDKRSATSANPGPVLHRRWQQ